VELFAALCALYAWQCLAWLPGGSALVWSTWLGARIAWGPGFRLAALRPGALCAQAQRFPLVCRDGALHARGGTRWLARDSEAELPLTLALLRKAEASESWVCAEGHRLARGVDALDAQRLAALLRSLAADTPAERRREAESAVRASLSLKDAAAARDRVAQATSWLAVTSDVYLVNLLGFAPAAALSLGDELALRILAPALLALHAATLFCFGRAHAKLWPERRGERWQALFGVLIYPPGLLRAQQQLCTAALAGFHPAALAAALLPEREARDFLRAELLQAEARSEDPPAAELGFSLDTLERDALQALVAESGSSRAALLAAPERCDAHALAYCPACLCEYRRGDGECSDCELELAKFPEAAASTALQGR
jgi:hypothetical protein